MEDTSHTREIKSVCEKMIGAKIQPFYKSTLRDGEETCGDLLNPNIMGDAMENILWPYLQKAIPTIEEGPKQKSPDYKIGEEEYELKTFLKSPGFDIGGITGYITSLSQEGGVKRKLINTKYIIFEYEIDENFVLILNYWILSVCDICCGYGGQKPINIGGGNGLNIRPATKKQWTSEEENHKRTPSRFLDRIEKLISSDYYKVSPEEKKHKLLSINKQRIELNI